MAKRNSTKAESEYMGRVASLGCLIHGTPAVVHHIREDQGISERASNYLTIPLCPECHTGDFSIHMAKVQFEMTYGRELDLLAETIRRLSVIIG